LVFSSCHHPAQIQLEEAPPPAPPGKENTFLQILRLLSDATGVDFLNYKPGRVRTD
jgi:hypothetical protein